MLLDALYAVADAASRPILRLPLLTDLITKALTVPSTSDSLPFAASSAKVISTGVSSLVVSTEVVKALSNGDSLTPITQTACSSDAETPLLSVMVKRILRSPTPGVSLLLLKVTERTTSCTNSLVALALKVKLHATPLLTEEPLAKPIEVVPDISLLPAALSSQIPIPPGLTVGSVRLSATSALAIICMFSLPPFQSILPSRSLVAISLLTITGVCSVNKVHELPHTLLEIVGASFTGVTLTIA